MIIIMYQYNHLRPIGNWPLIGFGKVVLSVKQPFYG